MQLVMFTKMLAKLDVRRLGETVKELGFAGMDLAVRPGHPVNPENVETALPKAIEVWSGMGLVVGMVTTDTSLVDSRAAEAERVFAACGNRGVKYIKLGYYTWKPGENYWHRVGEIRRLLDGFAELGAKHGVLPCYHTHSGTFYGSNAAGLMHLFKDMDPKHIGAYIDTAHLKLNGEPFDMAIEMVRPYLRVVGIKDPRYAGRKREIVPLGDGLVDFVDVGRQLKAIKFQGPLTLHSEYHMDTDGIIKTTRQDMKRFKGWMKEAGW
ncbi:MAG: sugar phosphate isomerase/epimerase [Phycisphaerae bacterium]|nr:sugar phosphate isomerase/epimerase [Phycisphaerae bacterium]